MPLSSSSNRRLLCLRLLLRPHPQQPFLPLHYPSETQGNPATSKATQAVIGSTRSPVLEVSIVVDAVQPAVVDHVLRPFRIGEGVERGLTFYA